MDTRTISRRNFMRMGVVIGAVASIPSLSWSDSGNNKPNILLIVPDDLGWSDVGYHNKDIRTPNIDKLAKSGIRLDQHYVYPTCTPTRASLMTGLYPSRYGVTGPAYGEVIDRGDPTLASLLSKNGYFTAIDGKWHMGSPPHTPLKYGFQSSYGYFDGQIDPYTHHYKTGRKSWHRNDEYLDEEGHVTDLITEEAVRIIEEDRDKPFFLYVAHHVPHYPLDEPAERMSVYDNASMSPSRKLFAASVTHMDDGIGRLIDALDRSGKRKDTLIIFISDNGGQKSWRSNSEYKGRYTDKPHNELGNNSPLRGWKGQLYEGGIRTPAFINWQGHLEPGQINSPIHISDWLPTLCSLTDCQEDLRPDLDGQNIWPLITGDKEPDHSRSMYWKDPSGSAIRKGKWKLITHKNRRELYDLENDPFEKHDLSDKNPEKVKNLMELMKEIKKADR